MLHRQDCVLVLGYCAMVCTLHAAVMLRSHPAVGLVQLPAPGEMSAYPILIAENKMLGDVPSTTCPPTRLDSCLLEGDVQAVSLRDNKQPISGC